jgi:hypothetical protein
MNALSFLLARFGLILDFGNFLGFIDRIRFGAGFCRLLIGDGLDNLSPQHPFKVP